MNFTRIMFDRVNNNSLYNCPTPTRRKNKFNYNQNFQ